MLYCANLQAGSGPGELGESVGLKTAMPLVQETEECTV